MFSLIFNNNNRKSRLLSFLQFSGAQNVKQMEDMKQKDVKYLAAGTVFITPRFITANFEYFVISDRFGTSGFRPDSRHSDSRAGITNGMRWNRDPGPGMSFQKFPGSSTGPGWVLENAMW